MICNTTSHLRVTEIERLVTTKAIIGEVVREEDVELCFDIVVSHLVQKVHGFCSGTIPGD